MRGIYCAVREIVGDSCNDAAFLHAAMSLDSHRDSCFIAVAILLAAGTPDASAGRGWCRADPLLLINGEIADVWVGSTLQALVETTGPIRLVVTTPEGVEAQHVISDLGFGHGYDIAISTSPELEWTPEGIELTIAVWVPARVELPVTVEFAPRVLGILWPASASGSTNSWVIVQTDF